MKTVNLISVPVSNQEVSKEFYIKMGLRTELKYDAKKN